MKAIIKTYNYEAVLNRKNVKMYNITAQSEERAKELLKKELIEDDYDVEDFRIELLGGAKGQFDKFHKEESIEFDYE